MVRLVPVLALLAGCDMVFGLDRDPHGGDGGIGDGGIGDDDDGDGKPNDTDPCPHIKDESPTDADGDGISADCDDDDLVDSQRRYLSFPGGDLGGSSLTGEYTPQDGYLMLGSIADVFSYVELDVDTGNVLVGVELEIVENEIENGARGQPWAEIGVFTVVRSITADDISMAGDVCFFGLDLSVTDPGYFEFREDGAAAREAVRFPGPLTGTSGRFRQLRSPARVRCDLLRTGAPSRSGDFVVATLSGQTGRIVVSAQRMRIKLNAIWASYK